MFKFFLALVMAIFFTFNGNVFAEESCKICFAHKDEFFCVQAENVERLIEKVEDLDLPADEYMVFIQKSVGWELKKYFAKDKRIDSARLIKSGVVLPEKVLQKVEKEAQDERYYLARVKIK